MQFPEVRPRRLRRTDALRRMVRETRLSTDHLMMPYFVVPGEGIRSPITAMPGQFRLSVDEVVKDAEKASRLGIPAFLLFGLPPAKDPEGSPAHDPEGPVPQALRALRRALPEACLVADVCLCEYTSHGHCGLLREGEVDNDPTLELLARASLAYAEAGADVVAPSDMMDGRVGAIRTALDRAGYSRTVLMSYAAKYASGYYGPFRDAADSAPQFGDRRGYQMDPPNLREAMREMEQDAGEGADILMVKPALAYLDVLAEARRRFDHPLAAYNVSGEYSMVKAAAAQGWIDERRVVMETLTGIRRAGADILITYHAVEAATWLS